MAKKKRVKKWKLLWDVRTKFLRQSRVAARLDSDTWDSQNGRYKIKMIKRAYEGHGKFWEASNHRNLQTAKKAFFNQCLLGMSKFSLTRNWAENPEPQFLVPVGVWEVHQVAPTRHYFQLSEILSLHDRKPFPVQSLIYVFSYQGIVASQF